MSWLGDFKVFQKLFFSLLVITLGINFINSTSFAQDEPVLGGQAFCTIRGNSPFKKSTSDGNRLLILQSNGISKG